MLRSMGCATALAVATAVAHAQQSEEVKKLQQRVDRLEAQSRGQSQFGFNPEISVILQGTAARIQQDPGTYQITGFAPSGGEVGPPRRGFSLAESELWLGGNIDPYFRGQLVAALTPEDEIEVEEAFFQTLAIGGGLTLKGGRFLSGIGYQNEIHQHAWDFQDAPLAYKAFLGGRLNDDGVQVKWVAPTPFLLELGAEVGRGRSFPATDPNRNGAGAWSAFGHVGGDLAGAAWRAGVSYLRAKPDQRPFDDVDSLGGATVQSFTGESRLWIADFVAKWRDLKLQAEYFRRKEDGELSFDDSGSSALFGALTDGYKSEQSGWYIQAVYRFLPQWRVGYRYDRLDHGEVSNGIVDNGLGPAAADLPLLMTGHNPTRNTLMVDWSATEFSRVRLQFAQDKSRAGLTDDQVIVQYVMSLGAHGAHKF
jgi:hypothetical protein